MSSMNRWLGWNASSLSVRAHCRRWSRRQAPGKERRKKRCKEKWKKKGRK